MEKITTAALNYSGGFDSLNAAIHLAPRVKNLHLVTFRTQTGHLTDLCKQNIPVLRRKFPSTNIIHRIEDVHNIHRVITGGIRLSCEKYKENWTPLGLWCCSCQLALRTGLLIYCLRNSIQYAADGSIRKQYFHSSHKIQVINAIKRFYGEYGILFDVPVYEHEPDTDQSAIFKAEGYHIGINLPGIFKSNQPFCIMMPFSILRQRINDHSTPEDVIGDYVHSRTPVMRSIVEAYCNDNGIHIPRECALDPAGMYLLERTGQEQRTGHTISRLMRLLWIMLGPVYRALNIFVRSRDPEHGR